MNVSDEIRRIKNELTDINIRLTNVRSTTPGGAIGYTDMQAIADPGAPAAGFVRFFANDHHLIAIPSTDVWHDLSAGAKGVSSCIHGFITVTDAGGLNITWDAGIVFDALIEGGSQMVDIAAQPVNQACTASAINYLFYDHSAGVLVLDTAGPDYTDGDFSIAHILTLHNDILDIFQRPVCQESTHEIKHVLRHGLGVAITEGMLISEHAGGAAFDVDQSAGIMIYGGFDVIHGLLIDSTVTNIIRWYHNAADAWETDTNAQIDAANWDDPTDGAAPIGNNAAKYYRSTFYTCGDRIHWVYPQVEYNTLNQALEAPDPTPPAVLGKIPKTVTVVLKGNAAAFPASGSDQWIDVRPMIGIGSSGGVITDHVNLSGLTWATCGHVGTASRLAGFDGAGAAAEYTRGIADDNILEVDMGAGLTVGDFVRATANGLESRTEAQFKADVNLQIGVDVLAQQAIGIADDNLLEVDMGAGLTNGDILRATAAGVESRTDAEILAQLSDQAGATFGLNDQRLENVLSLEVKDISVDTVDDYMGFENAHKKTAGVTDANDDFYAHDNYVALDQAGGVIGYLSAIYTEAWLIDGTISHDLEAIYNKVVISGGVCSGDVIGSTDFIDMNGGSIDDLFGHITRLDVEAALTISGDVYGHYIEADIDTDPTGDVYMLYLKEYSNVDYGIYQDGSALNVLGGALQLDTVADAGADVDKFLVLDAGNVIDYRTGSEVIEDLGLVVGHNLLSNPGFGVWSQSDTNKGVGTLGYDAGDSGGGDAPDVGDTVTGDDSGATGKIQSYTLAGTFAGSDAAGILTLGACTGRFHDNEGLTFEDGETAVANAPDAAATDVGDLVQNGDFSADTDPPPGWTAYNSTLTTEAGGQVGNCLMITNPGAAVGGAIQLIGVTVGKIYKLTLYYKNGTGGGGYFHVGSGVDNTAYFDSGAITDAAWTEYTVTFEAVHAVARIAFFTFSATAGHTSYWDEVSLWEITPCCTGADALALDSWVKDTTVDIYREHSGSDTKDGSLYANKFVVSAASDYIRFPGANYDNEEWYMQFQGRTVTAGLWIKTSKASHAKVTITDSAGSTSSSYHTGGGAYEWLEVTHTVNTAATSLAFYLYGDQVGEVGGDTIVYHSQTMGVFGSSVGSGNYSPKPQEIILLEKKIPSNLLDGETSKSDVAVANLNIESDSLAMLPKGCKEVKILTQCNDAGSAGTDCYLRFRADSTKDYEYYNSPYGLANDADNRELNWQQCDANGDIDYNLEASGASTFDIDQMDYVAVRVN